MDSKILDAKEISIFMLDGTLTGIKTAEVKGNIEQAIFIPRKKLKEVEPLGLKEAKYYGIYFLFGKDEAIGKSKAYIGQSNECLKRVKQHDNPKEDYWTEAIIIISKTQSFQNTEISYLEELAIAEAAAANRFELTNTKTPNKNKNAVSKTSEPTLKRHFEIIKILLPTLGHYPLFESINKTNSNDILICKRKEVNAEGEYLDDGFVVFKGSKAAKQLATTSNSSIKNLREFLIKQNVLVDKGNILEFKEDYKFNTPSSAATQVFGSSANGWTEWKDKDGKTLDELKRK